MASKRCVTLWLTRSSHFTDVDLWFEEPAWNAEKGEFVPGEVRQNAADGFITSFCENELAHILGIKLNVGQCKPIEIRPQCLVKRIRKTE